MVEKLLSICIPTYNRAEYLKESLDSLYRQIDSNNNQYVEVLVSNNCSTDQTDKIVREYLSYGMEITYVKNDRNLGAEGNYLQCIYKASGKYILLLGDDDLLLTGAVNTLIRILKESVYGVIYISGWLYKDKGEKAPDFKDVDVANGICNDVNDYLEKVLINITFVSGNIFNKSLIGTLDNYQKYKSTELLQVAIFIVAAARAERNLYLKEKFLAVGGNAVNNGGYGLYTVFGVNLFDILNDYKTVGITKSTIEKIANFTLMHWLPGGIMLSRKNKQFEDENVCVLEKYHKYNWRYRFIDRPLHMLPMPVAVIHFYVCKIFCKIYYKIQKA